MLQISQEQMQALENAQMRRFEDGLVRHLQENFSTVAPEHDLADARLRSLIRRGIQRSKYYDIINEYDVVRFIECSVEYGVDFETLPWVSPILTASHLSGEEKMDRLNAVSTFNLR